MTTREEGPDAPTDDDLNDCPECDDGKMYPLIKRSLVSESNPQCYRCDKCDYEECGE